MKNQKQGNKGTANYIEMNSKEFDVTVGGLNLIHTFYTKKHILNTIKKMKMKYQLIKLDKTTRRVLKEMDLRETEKHSHYFSFIRFFEEEGEVFGLVGGKTTYTNPDVFPDKAKSSEKRYARIFLGASPKRHWHKEVLIVRHADTKFAEEDNQQAMFIECFLQRTFHLFDS